MYAPHADFCSGPAIKDALGYLQSREDTLASDAVARYQRFCRENELKGPGAAAGVSVSWLEESHDVLGRLMFHARHSDVVVLGRARHRDFMPSGIIESLLVGCGRPVVIAPDAPAPDTIRTIVVGWKEAPQAARALSAALPLLLEAQRVILLGIEEPGASAQEALEDLALALVWHGISAEVLLKPNATEPVTTQLPRTAAELGADLLVVGGFGHSQLRENLLGGVTRTLINGCSVPVFMMH